MGLPPRNKKGSDSIPKKLITAEQEQQVLALNSTNPLMSLSEIGKQTGLSPWLVNRVFTENGVSKQTEVDYYHNLMRNHTSQMIAMYNNRQTLEDIEHYLRSVGVERISEETIGKWLKENGIQLRDSQEKNHTTTLMPEVFSTYTPESCYWGGLIAADGCIHHRTGASENAGWQLVFALVNDKASVEGLKKFVHYTGKIGERKIAEGKTLYQLSIVSKPLVDTLRTMFNIVPRKSEIFTPTDTIPKELRKFFILGYFDGNGCLTCCKTLTSRLQFGLSFTGSKQVCEWIMKELGLNVVLVQRRKEYENNCYTLNIQGNVQLYHIMKSFYSDSHINDICMNRKYKKFEMLRQQIITTYGKEL